MFWFFKVNGCPYETYISTSLGLLPHGDADSSAELLCFPQMMELEDHVLSQLWSLNKG